MATIQTVTGPIGSAQLGTTLIHEHLLARDEAVHAQWPGAGAIREDPPHAVRPGRRVRRGCRRRAARARQRRALDLRPDRDVPRRDIAFMRRVSEETGLQVVPCTGIYTYDHLPSFFVSRDPDQIAELFVADI
jgi:phosphotriesterase-related protein